MIRFSHSLFCCSISRLGDLRSGNAEQPHRLSRHTHSDLQLGANRNVFNKPAQRIGKKIVPLMAAVVAFGLTGADSELGFTGEMIIEDD
jgi:hypothetical protein